MTSTLVSSTTRIVGASIDKSAPAVQVYRIRKAFAVVQFDLAAKGRIVFLPDGAELRIIGPSCLSQCFEVVCNNQRYNIFQVDLLGPWSTPIKNGRSGAMRARAIGACA